MNTEELTIESWRPSHVIALGYSDGPTQGLLRLQTGQDFWFDLVVEDIDLDVRVFILRLLPADLFDSAVATIERFLGRPRWPIWVPLWQFGENEESNLVEDQLDRIRAGGVTSLAIACSGDFHHGIALKEIADETVRTRDEWFAFLEIT